MPLSRNSLVIAAGLLLGATAAIAAPSASKPPAQKSTDDGPTPTASDCTLPSKTKCLSMVKVGGEDVPYIETACGMTHKATCKGYVHEEIEKHQAEAKADSSLPAVAMLRPAQTDMPKHITTGKYHKHEASESRLASDYDKERKSYKKADDLLLGYGGYNMAKRLPTAREEHVPVSTAIAYWRNTAWRDNGNKVRSCKEYAYARSFTASRFVDAASRCRGDRDCVFDVAYSATPEGISDRDLRDEDGVSKGKLAAPTGNVAKNEMFPKGIEGFIRANGRDDKLGDTQEILDLEQALIEGQTFYKFGTCNGNQCDNVKKFKNVWTWHTAMRTINATVSEAEAEEYERRRAQFRKLLDKWHAAVDAEAIPEQRTGQKIVLPLDMRAYDPFERIDFEREYIEQGRDQRQALQKKFGGQLFKKNAVDAMKQIRGAAQQQGSLRHGSTPAIGVLGMPAPTASKPTAEKKKKGPKAQADTHNFCNRPDDDWSLETAMQGPISCQIGKFLRDEWARHLAGQRSCIDPANRRCDWTMMTFESTVLAQLPALDAQLSDEHYCDAYLDTDTFKDDDRGPATVTNVKTRLDQRREIIERELEGVSEFRKGPGDVGERLGKDWTGGDYGGDKKSFGAGYDYDVGWVVEPAKKVADGDQKGLVCEMKGSVHGDMSFDAYLVGKKFPIVSGAVRVRSQPGSNGGNAEYKAHLKMFDMSLYQSANAGWKGTQTFADDPVPFDIEEVPDTRPRFDVMVGPVPVSGQVYGVLTFGSALSVGGKASQGCSATSPKFAVSGSYMPFFAASGIGKVGVGIAGLVSAGIRASLTLAMIGTPITFGMSTGSKDGGPSLDFSSSIDLMLASLGGRVSLYLEFLLYEEEFELFRWKGLSHNIPLMKKSASVSWTALK